MLDARRDCDIWRSRKFVANGERQLGPRRNEYMALADVVRVLVLRRRNGR